MPTVLHISDLHRDSGSGLTTNTLLESLRRDRDRYSAEGILPPDIAIVSGDIVYGVSGSDSASDVALQKQYDEALDFLSRLADIFFAGNRERVIVVPGNHDVSYPHVIRATSIEDLPSDKDKLALLAKQLAAEGTPWRWVWPEFALRLVTDQDQYERRMEPFSAFYRSFYEGRRIFTLDASGQFSLHDFPDIDITVVGFSSCCDNDIYNRSGRIHPDCVAGATQAVAELVRKGRVLVAVWHHNLSGAPRDCDYIDPEFLQTLMDGGFDLGLHGHQHRPQFLQHRFTADRKRTMAVISAGTLCGGPHSLPSGRMRSYNLIELDTVARTAAVNVREMKNSSFTLPVWGDAYVSEFSGSKMGFDMNARPRAALAIQAASEAMELLREDAAAAFALVRPHADDQLARRVAVEALLNLEDWACIRSFCVPPQSDSEIIAVCQALYELGDKDGLRAFLTSDPVARSNDAAVRQSVQQAMARLGDKK